MSDVGGLAEAIEADCRRGSGLTGSLLPINTHLGEDSGALFAQTSSLVLKARSQPRWVGSRTR